MSDLAQDDFLSDEITGRSTVYPDDCDHMGHMNVAAYTRKFDEATWAFWGSVGFSYDYMLAEGCGLAAMESRLTYHKELFPGESFVTRSRFVWIKPKVAQFHHRLYALKHGDAGMVEIKAATCTYTVACLDRAAHRARPFPEAIANRIQALLKPLPEGESS